MVPRPQPSPGVQTFRALDSSDNLINLKETTGVNQRDIIKEILGQ